MHFSSAIADLNNSLGFASPKHVKLTDYIDALQSQGRCWFTKPEAMKALGVATAPFHEATHRLASLLLFKTGKTEKSGSMGRQSDRALTIVRLLHTALLTFQTTSVARKPPIRAPSNQRPAKAKASSEPKAAKIPRDTTPSANA